MADRKENYHAIVASPLGMLGLVADSAVTCIDFLSPRHGTHSATTPLAREAVHQLARYFRDAAFVFDLPLELNGTTYQRRVWRALRCIPRGEVVSYGDLALRLTSGARAVGGACRANPVPIIVPCHRVVARRGLGGYTGGVAPNATKIKQWLLRHEGV